MFGELHPLSVGDFSTLSAWENDQESRVRDMIEFFKEDKHQYITSNDVTEAIKYFGIDYPNLPQWLKNTIDDEIEIV